MKSNAVLLGGFKSVVDNGRKHNLFTDLPPKKGGTDEGPTALELTVMGLSGCVSTIFAVVAGNSRLEFSDLSVEVDAEIPDGAEIFSKVTVAVTVKSDAGEEKVQRVLNKTLEVCPVGTLFEKAGVPMETSLTLRE